MAIAKVRDIPYTSDEALRKDRQQINKLNKSRARLMEGRVARYLRGTRVPMSGAARQWKGDCIIEFTNNPGKYIVECKLSAARKLDDFRLRIQFDWLTKIEREAIAMNAKFAILAIHFHGYRTDFVIVKKETLELIARRYTQDTYIPEIYNLINAPISKDVRYRVTGEPRTGYTLSRDALVKSMQGTFIKGTKYLFPSGEYVILSLEHFRDLVSTA